MRQIARASVYESGLAVLLFAQPTADDTLLASLRPHMMESDIHALGDVLRDERSRMNRKF